MGVGGCLQNFGFIHSYAHRNQCENIFVFFNVVGDVTFPKDAYNCDSTDSH